MGEILNKKECKARKAKATAETKRNSATRGGGHMAWLAKEKCHTLVPRGNCVSDVVFSYFVLFFSFCSGTVIQ